MRCVIQDKLKEINQCLQSIKVTAAQIFVGLINKFRVGSEMPEKKLLNQISYEIFFHFIC